MAEKRIPYNWENVEAGDIISFKYKSKNVRRTKLQTILVLNPFFRKGKSKQWENILTNEQNEIICEKFKAIRNP